MQSDSLLAVWWPALAAPCIVIICGAMLRKRSSTVYWGTAGAIAVVLSVAFYITTLHAVPPMLNSSAAMATVFVALPVLESMGLLRLTRTAPNTILSLALGCLGYIVAAAFTLIMATTVGLVAP